MQIVQTAVTAASPVLKIACFALAGVHLSRNGMLPPEGKLVLSKLGKCLFLPCLIFTKLGSTLDPSHLGTLWTIPAMALFNVLFGLLCGTALDRCLGTPGREGNLRTAFLAVGNLGNMPLVFVAALCDDPTSLVSGTADCRAVGQGYVMLGMWVGVGAQWTIADHMLRPPASAAEFTQLEAATVDDWDASSPRTDIELQTARPDATTLDLPPSAAQTVIKVVTQPPLLAVILAVFVALNGDVQNWVFDINSPIRVPISAIQGFGEAFIPITLLLLGSNLSKGPTKPRDAKALCNILTPVIIRLLVMPMLGGGLVWLMWYCRVVPADPLLLFVLLLINSTPSAVNLNLIATLHGFQQEDVAAILFYQYMAALVTMVLWLFLYFNLLAMVVE